MKNSTIIIALSSIFLFACGSSGGDSSTEIPKGDLTTKLSNTSWETECSIYNKLANDELTDAWNVKTKLSIDSSLKSTYKTAFFHPTDTTCNAILFDSLYTSTFKITGRVISEESIAANGLNETFIYNSDKRDLPVNYTLIYLDSEKLYFGQESGENLGETSATRHSSISLDNYFMQIVK